MNIEIQEIIDKKEKEEISREILYDLPGWFGMPESTEEYIINSQDKPFLACIIDDEPIGFVVMNATSKDCADIFVMGIKKNSTEWVSELHLTMLMKLWRKNLDTLIHK